MPEGRAPRVVPNVPTPLDNLYEKLHALLGLTDMWPTWAQSARLPNGGRSMPEMAFADFALDKALRFILNYCNLKILPAELDYVCISMTMDIYRADSMGDASGDGTGGHPGVGAVKSITEGSIRTEFDVSAKSLTAAASKAGKAGDESAYLTPYLTELRCFRKLRW